MDVLTTISELIPLSLTVIIGVLFASIIITLILDMQYFSRFKTLFWIICAPGVMLHEAAHYLFCILGGVEVGEVNLFFVQRTKRGPNIGGYVTHGKTGSFLAQFFISIGPIIVNGLVASLIIYFLFDVYRGLSYYLIFAFIFGAHPSSADLGNLSSPFKVDGRRAFFELISLFIAAIPAWFLATWKISFLNDINWLMFILVYFVTLLGLVSVYKISTER